MSFHQIDGKPHPVPAVGVLGALIGVASENLLAGPQSGVDDVITGAVVGAIIAMTLVLWLRSEKSM
jgi:hypothetical protein